LQLLTKRPRQLKPPVVLRHQGLQVLKERAAAFKNEVPRGITFLSIGMAKPDLPTQDTFWRLRGECALTITF